MFNSGYNMTAYVVYDERIQEREQIKVKLISDGGVFYTQNVSGISDTGHQLILSTWKNIKFSKNLKIIFNDILYSIKAIVPHIPDLDDTGFKRSHTNTEYVLYLGE